MAIVSAHKCDIGQRRTQNEDSVWVNEQVGLYIVADGMGGQEAGEVASCLTVTTVGQLITDQLKTESASLPTTAIKEIMVEAIETVNDTVHHAAQEAGHKRGMGSTIVMALVQSSTAYISHAGDSRAYLVRDFSLMQLTEDDSWGTEFGKATQSKKDGRNKIDHILTKSIGQPSMVGPSFTELRLTPGDCLLLCSDGLWDMVNDKQILTELKKAKFDPTQAAEALVAAANTAGGEDNISVVVIKML